MEFEEDQEVDILIKKGGIWINGFHLTPRGNIIVEFIDNEGRNSPKPEELRIPLPEVLSNFCSMKRNCLRYV